MSDPKKEGEGLKGAAFSGGKSSLETVLGFLKRTLAEGCFDALLLPVKAPGGDSFPYVLVQDKALLEDRGSPLPPIMPVQGGKAVSSLTRRGKAPRKVAALMRPCEVRATIELFKLAQVDLENIFLISIDCPGVLPVKDFAADPEKGMAAFGEVLEKWGDRKVRPVCQICHRFTAPLSDDGAGMVVDLHIGLLGIEDGEVLLIPYSPAGEEILAKLDLVPAAGGDILSAWRDRANELTKKRGEERRRAQEEMKSKVRGLNNLLETFDKCINCHNCMRVCPVCYCRLCYFDSEAVKHPPDDYLRRAGDWGSIRFLPDTILFQVGRMSHMSLSCVSCGTCEDACPMDIPVAQVFSLVADEAQEYFGYLPGRSTDEPIPLATYKEEELEEVEDAPQGASSETKEKDG